MNLQDIKNHHLYKLLAEKEQHFVDAYLLSEGDADASYREAFGKDLHINVVRRKAKKLLCREDIAPIVNAFFFGDEPSMDQVLRFIWQSAQTAKGDKDRTALLGLY